MVVVASGGITGLVLVLLLSIVLTKVILVESSRIQVHNFINNQEWDIQKLQRFLPLWLSHHITNLKIGNREKADFVKWTPAYDGVFSNKSAWNSIRDHRQTDHLISRVWHSSISFKFSFLSWRMIKGKLPFNEFICRFRNNRTLTCLCCHSPHTETLQHLFIDSEPAETLWKYFGHPLGIKYESKTVRGFLNDWWRTQAKNAIHKMLIQVLPVTICWELWKTRCACKYGNQTRFYTRRMEQQVLWHIRATMSRAYPNLKLDYPWVQLCDIVERLRPKIINRAVHWTMPNQGSIKINTDGSYIDHNGKAGIGGIARDCNGDFVFAFAVPAMCQNHNVAEALAAQYAGQWIKDNNHRQCTIEMDSMLIVNMLKNKKTNNLNLKTCVDDIVDLTKGADTTFSHCYREANKVADFLAKLATTLEEPVLYHNLNQMPGGAKGPYLLDKRQLPSVRIKYDKANFFIS